MAVLYNLTVVVGRAVFWELDNMFPSGWMVVVMVMAMLVVTVVRMVVVTVVEMVVRMVVRNGGDGDDGWLNGGHDDDVKGVLA